MKGAAPPLFGVINPGGVAKEYFGCNQLYCEGCVYLNILGSRKFLATLPFYHARAILLPAVTVKVIESAPPFETPDARPHPA